MKYFVDPDTHWDGKGYREQLHSLEPRVSKSTFGIFSKIDFHDAEVLTMQVTNLATWGRPRVKDPTEVVIRLWHPNEYVYTLKYGGVTAIDFAFDWREMVYQGLHEQDPSWHWVDRRGIDDWLWDELTAHDDAYLQHEVGFASGATLRLVFRRLSCTRSRHKRRYAEAQRSKGRLD
jgi:hypothetical protein